jgi:predicted RNase H-like HicB family nuclease
MRYRYLIVYEPSTTGYGACVPDLPGCVAAGVSLAATRELMREALAAHLEGMREDGEEIPVTDPGEVAEYLEVELSALPDH